MTSLLMITVMTMTEEMLTLDDDVGDRGCSKVIKSLDVM
jgi:hypothetical protein